MLLSNTLQKARYGEITESWKAINFVVVAATPITTRPIVFLQLNVKRLICIEKIETYRKIQFEKLHLSFISNMSMPKLQYTVDTLCELDMITVKMLSHGCSLISLPQYVRFFYIPKPQNESSRTEQEEEIVSTVLVQVIMCHKMNISLPVIVLASTSNQSAPVQYVTQLDFTMRQEQRLPKFQLLCHIMLLLCFYLV